MGNFYCLVVYLLCFPRSDAHDFLRVSSILFHGQDELSICRRDHLDCLVKYPIGETIIFNRYIIITIVIVMLLLLRLGFIKVRTHHITDGSMRSPAQKGHRCRRWS